MRSGNRKQNFLGRSGRDQFERGMFGWRHKRFWDGQLLGIGVKGLFGWWRSENGEQEFGSLSARVSPCCRGSPDSVHKISLRRKGVKLRDAMGNQIILPADTFYRPLWEWCILRLVGRRPRSPLSLLG